MQRTSSKPRHPDGNVHGRRWYPPCIFTFPGNANEQTSLKPLEEKVLEDFGCTKFIYCSDAGLGSEAIKRINHAGERAFIVTQSIKKLNKDDKKWALGRTGF